MSEERPKLRHKRLETLNLVSLSHKDPDGRVDLETVGRTLDLSEGGILLECSQRVPSESRDVEVVLGIREHVIKVTGEIVHMRDLDEGNIGLGIAFKNLSDEDARVIIDFMSEDEE
ncbi:MAG: PilZ domain-containing protein [Pseudomonadota bacterium]